MESFGGIGSALLNEPLFLIEMFGDYGTRHINWPFLDVAW